MSTWVRRWKVPRATHSRIRLARELYSSRIADCAKRCPRRLQTHGRQRISLVRHLLGTHSGLLVRSTLQPDGRFDRVDAGGLWRVGLNHAGKVLDLKGAASVLRVRKEGAGDGLGHAEPFYPTCRRSTECQRSRLVQPRAAAQ